MKININYILINTTYYNDDISRVFLASYSCTFSGISKILTKVPEDFDLKEIGL